MTEIRPVELPEKDLPLRADVSLLGSLLGNMLVDQYGADLLEKVEAIRKAAILRREQGEKAAIDLNQALAGLKSDEVRQVIQAFSSYMRMVNLAERVHRIRRRRAYQLAGSSAQRGSIEAVMTELKASGITSSELLTELKNLQILPVFTAHPTEATRRTILEKEYDILLRLVERLNPELTPNEHSLGLKRITAALTSAWQTRLVPNVRPTVADELDNILFYVTDILYRVVPVFYESISSAFEKVYLQADAGVEWFKTLRFGSWVGGDMDGNPNVTAVTIKDTLARQRQVIIERYLSEVRALGRYLSQTVSEIGVSRPVLEQVAHYQELIPTLSERLPARHRDMPYRCLLVGVAARLEATAVEGKNAYPDVLSFCNDLQTIEESLLENKGEHAGLFRVRRLLLRVRTFGFHLLTLDVRQDSLEHRKAIAEWLGDEQWLSLSANDRTQRLSKLLQMPNLPDLPTETERSEGLVQTLAVFKTIDRVRKQYGEDAVGLFIISMAQGADDVLSVMVLSRVANDNNGSDRALDIAPLLETVDDLAAGPAILRSLLEQQVYRHHLELHENRQVVMVGYSDSNKDSGIVSARWALQEAQKKLLDVGKLHDLKVVFFHGRGGTVSRGGGNLVNGILGAPLGSINGFMRLTEQGEVINQKYGVRPIALRNLELVSGAVLTHQLIPDGLAKKGHVLSEKTISERSTILSSMAQVSRQKFRGLVYQDERFPRFFRTFTPIDVIERLTIGSRPSARRSGEGIENLRAIPWVFSWAQTRMGFPGVYGMGTALQQAVNEFGIDRMRALLKDWRFFRAMVEDVEMVLAKSETEIGTGYAELVPDSHVDLFQLILDEFAQTRRWILELKQSTQLLEDQHTLQRNIRLRNPYVDPLHMLQIDLLKRWRQGDRQDQDLQKALMATVNGIALGIQNTG